MNIDPFADLKTISEIQVQEILQNKAVQFNRQRFIQWMETICYRLEI